MGYIALEMSGGEWGIYRRETGKPRALVASGLYKGHAEALTNRANRAPLFPKDGVLHCGGVWH